MTSVAIIDSGGANIASLLFAFERLQEDAVLTLNANVIQNADRVLLPGVGAAKDAMTRLQDAGLVDIIRKLKQPVLGICLGMQLLCDSSEEEDVDCLGIIPGRVTKLQSDAQNPVPNMGWCATTNNNTHRQSKAILTGVPPDSFFYYLHSYALPVGAHTLAVAKHSDHFSAIIGKDNFVATQFHPERSSAAGSQLLRNFLGSPP